MPSLLLWAGEAVSPPKHSNVVSWHAVPEHPAARSIIAVVEEHAEEVRRRYLSWCHDFGEVSALGRRLRDWFAFGRATNLWFQSVFVEQSPWCQRSLEPILKLIALELLLEQERPGRVQFVGEDRDLGAALGRVCLLQGVAFEWDKPRRRRAVSARRLVHRLPHAVQGVLLLARLAARRLQFSAPPLKVRDKNDPARTVLIVGPFFNFYADEPTRAGTFASRFWTLLPAMLKEEGMRLTWLHIFYRHGQTRTPAAAAEALMLINRSCDRGESHVLLDACLSFGGACRILLHWIRHAIASLRVERALQARWTADPLLRYWPLLRFDWARAFRGVACVEGLFQAECFAQALCALPSQGEGLYLMENQGWERALASAWRRYGHGRLTGVVHSTIRFWDLRYHTDARNYTSQRSPGPDVVALNGRATREAYLSTLKSREALADCEALRYLHLRQDALKLQTTADSRPLKILVLGDFTSAGTAAVLGLLAAAHDLVQIPLEVRVKPHPNCPVLPAHCPGFELAIVESPVAVQAHEVDLVLAGNLTSAAVDAYASGAQVLIHNDGNGLNYSPLRGVPGASFVRTPNELCEALRAAAACASPGRMPDERFFNIDTSLPRWRAYLGIGSCGSQEVSSRHAYNAQNEDS